MQVSLWCNATVEMLTGFAFRGFRSFYGDLQVISPLSKINLIAGQNNSGKSNVLRVAERLDNLTKRLPKDLDVPRVPHEPFELAIKLGDVEAVRDRYCEAEGIEARRPQGKALTEVLGSPGLRIAGQDGIWLRWFQDDYSSNESFSVQSELIARSHPAIANFSPRRSMSHSANAKRNASILLKILVGFLEIPPARFIQASRRVFEAVDGEELSETDQLSGANLVRRLLALQNPALDRDNADRRRFAGINRFVKTVLDDETASLEIPHDAAQINVRRSGLLLPLDYLGTGVTQVVILAAAATLLGNTLVCMEEPEVHLHPLLQRKLLRYLAEETSNQYFIATHSAHLLDSDLASVFHATYAKTGTEVNFAGRPKRLSEICVDLGYRPSDLLQTNCVIWVEGPSDRIYLLRWLKIANNNLREGIDFSIMFYGGRLLNHLSAKDPEVNQFISLRRMNRYLAVVMDSDKEKAQSRVGATKKRVVKEVEERTDGEGVAWITSGRTIENYVPPDVLDSVLRGRHPGRQFMRNADKYSDVMRAKMAREKGADKIKVAKEVTRRWKSGLDYLDLHARVVELARLIEDANARQRHITVAKSTPVFDEAGFVDGED